MKWPTIAWEFTLKEYQPDLVQDMYTYVLAMLEGSHESCKRIRLEMKPSKYFIIGSLSDASKAYEIGETIGQTREQTRTLFVIIACPLVIKFQGTIRVN